MKRYYAAVNNDSLESELPNGWFGRQKLDELGLFYVINFSNIEGITKTVDNIEYEYVLKFNSLENLVFDYIDSIISFDSDINQEFLDAMFGTFSTDFIIIERNLGTKKYKILDEINKSLYLAIILQSILNNR